MRIWSCPVQAALGIQTGVQDVKETEIAHWEDHVEDNLGVLVYCLTSAKNVREGFLG